MSNPSIMTISVLLISGKGRIPRSTYWLKYFAPYLVIYSMMVLVDIAAGTFDARHWGIFRDLHSSRVVAIDGVSVKRCHERNRSGWFLRRCNLTDRFSSLGKISGLASLSSLSCALIATQASKAPAEHSLQANAREGEESDGPIDTLAEARPARP
jgi:hypothetical protein